MKQVAVLVGAGSIGQAIIRRVGAGKHIGLPTIAWNMQSKQPRHWRTQASSALLSSVTLD